MTPDISLVSDGSDTQKPRKKGRPTGQKNPINHKAGRPKWAPQFAPAARSSSSKRSRFNDDPQMVTPDRPVHYFFRKKAAPIPVPTTTPIAATPASDEILTTPAVKNPVSRMVQPMQNINEILQEVMGHETFGMFG